MLIYNGQIIAGGGTIVLPMTRAEYEANKAILDSADVWVDLTDEPDQIATADQVAFWVGQTQKGMGYIGDIATKAIAKVEPTDTALYLHEVGTGFINKDGNYCITDIQIAVGGTIVLGTNCHVVDGGISSNLSVIKLIETQANTTNVSSMGVITGDLTFSVPSGYKIVGCYPISTQNTRNFLYSYVISDNTITVIAMNISNSAKDAKLQATVYAIKESIIS